MSHPRQLVVFWRVQPIEAVIFLAAVFIIIFTNIENGIYVATGCKFMKLVVDGKLLLNYIRFFGPSPLAYRTSSRPVPG